VKLVEKQETKLVGFHDGKTVNETCRILTNGYHTKLV